MASRFSNQLAAWLKQPGKKTFGDLENIFKEKSFAVAFLILMAPAALPLPTGGLTHVFEIITMLLALEMIFGRKQLWMPAKWRQQNLGSITTKALPKMVSFINGFERRSKHRLINMMNNDLFLRLVGMIVFVLALGALLAVPFSGLDTLPALGVVILALGLILEDFLLIPIAITIGVVGVVLEITFGSVAWHFLMR